MLQTFKTPLRGELTFALELAARMRTRKLRSYVRFAEEEIILPTGPKKDMRFRTKWSPAARLFLQELDRGIWQRTVWTGPNQDGKTLLLSIVLMYLLFERRETVVFGVPSLDMASDKWQIDILPVIRKSRYRDHLPTSGAGSRGGDAVTIEFRDGQLLRIMTAGGDDQSRAGFTSSNLAVTEADGFDEVGANSREGDKFSQLVKRTLAFPETSKIFAECTVTTESGRIWQEYTRGSHSRIALPCPQCGAWVTPEREHLVGWQDAQSEAEAIARAAIACPACGVIWTNGQRVEANHRAVLVHRGQVVATDGQVFGDLPPTRTFGFRWTAVNSILSPNRLALVAGEEWNAQRAEDEVVAERNLLQMQWVRPQKSSTREVTEFDEDKVMRRTIKALARGICPDDTECVTVGCDVGLRICHWLAVAWRPGGSPHVLTYDVIEVPSSIMSPEEAIKVALRDWRDEHLAHGWQLRTGKIYSSVNCVDARYYPEPVLSVCEESGEEWIGTQGYGATQRRPRGRTTKTKVIEYGEDYNLVELESNRRRVLEVNSDRWKSFAAARMVTPLGQAGEFTLYDPTVGLTGRALQGETLRHRTFAKHLTAERQREEFDPRLGTVTRWYQVRDANHWGDAFENACVAGHRAGVRLMASIPSPPTEPATAGRPAVSFAQRWRGVYS
jgi:hypothetical protein